MMGSLSFINISEKLEGSKALNVPHLPKFVLFDRILTGKFCSGPFDLDGIKYVTKRVGYNKVSETIHFPKIKIIGIVD